MTDNLCALVVARTDDFPFDHLPDVETFAQLASYVHAFRKDGYWIFRGVQRHIYDLKPKIGRPGARKNWDGKDLDYDKAQETRLLDHFRNSVTPYLQHTLPTDLQWLALAQHHGMFTRLLDWTESLLIAAWFAVELGTREGQRDAETGKEITYIPTIYAVKNIPGILTEYKGRLDDLYDVAMFHPPHLSPRIPAQRSVFTIHKRPEQAYVPQSQNEKLLAIRIFGNPLTFKHDLHAAGINEASLFPGIDGLARHLSWLYKWRSLAPGAEL